MRIPDGVNFDELNKLYAAEKGDDLRSMPFDQFFGEMGLSKEQEDKRKETASAVKAFMMIALAELFYERQEGDYWTYDPSGTIRENYRSLIDRLAIPLTALFAATRADELAADVVDSTMRNQDDAYFFSEDRATLIAENEANSIWNDSEYQDAILTGKTHKTWVAIKDKRTRDTHRAVDGTTLRIDEYFQVGEAMLLYPRMSCEYPEEVVNCRCTLIYS